MRIEAPKFPTVLKDDSADPVDEALGIVCIQTGKVTFRAWGYKPKLDGKSDGSVCLYCLKVFDGRYSKKVNPDTQKMYTMTTLIIYIGSHEDELAKVVKCPMLYI